MVLVTSVDQGEHSLPLVRRFGAAHGSRPSWLPDTTVGLVAAGLALLLPLLVVRVTEVPVWSARYALLPLEAAVGLPLLVGLLRPARHRYAAAAALAFVGVATISTLRSDNPAMSFWGQQFLGTGLLFVIALTAMWAIGASGGKAGAVAIERALVVGALVNAVVALVQTHVDLSRFGATPYPAQSTGLLGQPVFLAELLLGALWLMLDRASSRGIVVRHGRSLALAAALFVLAAGLEASAERVPLLLTPVLVLVTTWRRPVTIKVTLGLVVAAGLLVGWGLTSFGHQQNTTATARLGGVVDGQPRLENYENGLRALASSPMLGSGPARYLSATSADRSLELSRADPDMYFVDAHNWPLHWAVTTGLLGLAALASWFWFAARAATSATSTTSTTHGPLLGFAACIAAVQLVQPEDVTVTALAVLALGAASAGPRTPVAVPRAARAALVGVGAAVAACALVGSWQAYRGSTGDSQQAINAARWFPHWPERADQAARGALAVEEGTASERVEQSRLWAGQAIARDSSDPRTVTSAGFYQLIAGAFDDAQSTFELALRLDPHSPRALAGRGLVELRRGSPQDAVPWLEQALAISPDDAFVQVFLQQARSSSQ